MMDWQGRALRRAWVWWYSGWPWMVPMALAASGCDAPTCVELCESERACDDGSSSERTCEQTCRGLEQLNEEAGCGPAYADYLCCLDDFGICEATPTTCPVERDAWFSCTRSYCDQVPEDALCTRE